MEGWTPAPPDESEWPVVRSIEAGSPHPIAHVLVKAAEKHGAAFVPVMNREEIVGVGVAGEYGGDRYELRSLRDGDAVASYAGSGGARTDVGFYRNGSLVRVAHFSDRVRSDSAAAVERMNGAGVTTHLLTGDAEAPARAVAAAVGIERQNVAFAQSPEQKRDVIGSHPRALMAGDGVNDAVALAGAHVGVAVHGSMETSFKAADVYLTQPGLQPLADLFDLSSATISIVRRNLIFSLCYNTAGAGLALAGVINPLVAAVLMPASSITVLLMSVIGTRTWRRFGRVPAAEVAPPVTLQPRTENA